jgi:hypothetical protein
VLGLAHDRLKSNLLSRCSGSIGRRGSWLRRGVRDETHDVALQVRLRIFFNSIRCLSFRQVFLHCRGDPFLLLIGITAIVCCVGITWLLHLALACVAFLVLPEVFQFCLLVRLELIVLSRSMVSKLNTRIAYSGLGFQTGFLYSSRDVCVIISGDSRN